MSGHGFGGNVFALGVGVAFDGINLLLSCYNDNTVTAVSPANGAQVAVHHITNVSQLGALAWDNGRGLLWACSATDEVGTINMVTNVFTSVFTSGGCFDGLAYDGSDDTIWASADASSPVRHYTAAGGFIAAFPVSLGGFGNSGIGVGGSLLYLANNGGQQIYQVNKSFSPAPTLFASFPRRIEDLECDNITFAPANAAIWSVDAYDNILNAWEIPLGSCLFGGGGQLTLTPPTAENPVGSSHTVTAHLKDSSNLPISGATILFSVTVANTASGSGTTNPSGDAPFTYTGANLGTDTITACYDKNTNGTCDAGELTATATKTWVRPADEAITASPVPIAATEGIPFNGPVATFTDPDTAATAAEYSAMINWGDGTPTSAGTVSGTTTPGSFTVSGSHVYAEEGSYTVTVVITDIDTAANTATATSTATVADAALTSACAMVPFTTQAYAGPTATFTDASSTGTLSDFSATINWGDTTTSAGTIVGAGAPYTVSGSHTYTSTGPFTVTTTINDVGGSTTTATCNPTVFAFAPGGGSFAIGDTKSAVGTPVLFWGAQWAKNNPVSSGTTVSAFKGFALNPTVPTCGATWSTAPGNSTPPPDGPLPAYMGVIVTSHYSKSGSTISGDIAHIVIVRTDPGYEPNPGHAGTGTVFARVC